MSRLGFQGLTADFEQPVLERLPVIGFTEGLQQDREHKGWIGIVRIQSERGLDFFQPCQQLPGTFFVFQAGNDMRFYFRLEQFLNVLAKIVLGKDPIALVVEDFSLLIQYIVIFEQMLSAIKIGALDAGLGLLDRFVYDPVPNGRSIIDIEALHKTGNLIAAK